MGAGGEQSSRPQPQYPVACRTLGGGVVGRDLVLPRVSLCGMGQGGDQ